MPVAQLECQVADKSLCRTTAEQTCSEWSQKWSLNAEVIGEVLNPGGLDSELAPHLSWCHLVSGLEEDLGFTEVYMSPGKPCGTAASIPAGGAAS